MEDQKRWKRWALTEQSKCPTLFIQMTIVRRSETTSPLACSSRLFASEGEESASLLFLFFHFFLFLFLSFFPLF